MARGIFLIYLQERRLLFLFYFFFCAFLVLGGRLIYLQLLREKQLAAAAVEERTLRLSVGNFMRGDIQDCSGRSLLDAQITYGVAVFPSLVSSSFGVAVSHFSFSEHPSWENMFTRTILNVLPQRWDCKVMRSFLKRSLAKQVPFILPIILTKEEVASLEKLKVPGVFVVPLVRRYGPASKARHLVGCVKGAVLKGETPWGIKGIEGLYDSDLAPPDPYLELLTVVDSQGGLLKGRGLRLRGKGDRIKRGNNMILTIDRGVQEIVEEIMEKYEIRGAVVVLDVPSGEVRALASRPLYDQNTGSGDQFDRSLALYHPGSVFKIVVAAAALAEGEVQPDEKFFCSGKFEFNEKQTISCWKKEGHGSLTFQEAFASSCNPVFVEVALRLGREKIERYGRLLGLEEGLIGYPLPSRHGGVIKIGAYPGQLGNAALGQEGVQITPVSAAVLVATVARGGVYIPPVF